MDPNFTRTHIFLGETYVNKEMFPEAADEFGKVFMLNGMPPPAANNVVTMLKESFKSGGARAFFRKFAEILQVRLDQKDIDSPPPLITVAALWVQAGENEKALALLEQGVEKHDPDMLRVTADAFKPLKSEPRYYEILRKMNMPSPNW
jgi:hypothetical protein